jgi:hypothetical protein
MFWTSWLKNQLTEIQLTGIEPVVKEPVDRKSQSWETNSQIQNRNRVEGDQKIIKQEREAHNPQSTICNSRYAIRAVSDIVSRRATATPISISSSLGWQQPTRRRRERHREKVTTEQRRREHWKSTREDESTGNLPEKTRALETYPRRREHWKPTREEPDSLYAEGAWRASEVWVNPSSFSVSGDQLVALRTCGIFCEVIRSNYAKQNKNR